MTPQTLELQLHQVFELEKTMRIVHLMSQHEMLPYLLQVVKDIMIIDNMIKYVLVHNNIWTVPPEVEALTLEQQFSFQQMQSSKLNRNQTIVLIEQAWRIVMIKTNVLNNLLGKINCNPID